MSDDFHSQSIHSSEPSLTAPVPTTPEEHLVFRIGRLALLLSIVEDENIRVKTIDRLGYYDFFSDNPYIVVTGDGPRDEADKVSLRLAGFTSGQLNYASSGQRFASRRRRLQHDLGTMIAYGLILLGKDGYRLTTRGKVAVADLNTLYAESITESARIVVRRLSRLSDKQLTSSVESWLGHSWLLLDLLADVSETTPAPTRVEGGGHVHA